MDLSILGEQYTPYELNANAIAAKGPQNLFFEICDHDYKFSEAMEDLKNLLSDFDENCENAEYFSLENWSNGIENIIGDAWFNLVQFIKRLVRTIRTAINHFLSGMTMRLIYLEKMKVKLHTVQDLNISAMEHTITPAYTRNDFIELFKGLEAIRRTLTNLFMKQDFDLDGIMDFRQYGITFVNGAINKNYGNDVRSSVFDLGFKQDASKEAAKLGWNISSIPFALEKLIEYVKYDIQKDYDYIKFQAAMDRLIRTKEKDAKKDFDEIKRLTNVAKSMASMVAYSANTTWKMSKQMVTMLKALESPPKEQRSGNVY